MRYPETIATASAMPVDAVTQITPKPEIIAGINDIHHWHSRAIFSKTSQSSQYIIIQSFTLIHSIRHQK